MLWLAFSALAWALWNIRNKSLIEGKILSSPSDGLYKLVVYLQLWTPLSRRPERDAISSLIEAIKLKIGELRATVE